MIKKINQLTISNETDLPINKLHITSLIEDALTDYQDKSAPIARESEYINILGAVVARAKVAFASIESSRPSLHIMIYKAHTNQNLYYGIEEKKLIIKREINDF